MYLVVADVHLILGLSHHCHFHKCASIDTLEHHIALGFCFGALLIVCGLPGEHILAVAAVGYGKRVDGQWLNHIVATIALGYKLKHTFIYSAANGETECGIQSVAHIGKILMREEFEQHCWHFGYAGFVVRLVPHAATAPIGLKQCSHIVADVGGDKVGEMARISAWRAIGIVAEIIAHIYAERAHNAVVGRGAGIAVKCKCQVDGDIQTGALGQHC